MVPGLKAEAIELIPTNLQRIASGENSTLVDSNSLIVCLTPQDSPFAKSLNKQFPSAKLRFLPSITFPAYHPDCEYIYKNYGTDSTTTFATPVCGHYQSAITFWSWKQGLSKQDTRRLFRYDVYNHLGYFSLFESAKKRLLQTGRDSLFPLERFLQEWIKCGSFMHSINHPKLFVLAQIAREFLLREGFEPLPHVENYMHDAFLNHGCWPVYPEVAEQLGISGDSYHFKKAGPELHMVSLEEFIDSSFEAYSKHDRNSLVCPRHDTEGFKTLKAYLERKSAHLNGTDLRQAPAGGILSGSPYRHLPAHQFWSKSVARVPRDEIDPVITPLFRLSKTDKVATAGSCFAQHISRSLALEGFNYFIAEQGPEDMSKADCVERNYGMFSARYGNIYTARQLVQLFDRAHGYLQPQESVWQRDDGKFVDPFRPQIEPAGFATEAEMLESRNEHLALVKQMFAKLDVLVFTLGLTEAWEHLGDGAVFPLAPGVTGGSIDWQKHRFRNFTASEIIDDLELFLLKLLGVNPCARVLLTVSPVPLIATYENQHVLVSNTRSKAILRTVAGHIVKRHSNCDYFPSYEIITGLHAGSDYYERDLRSVKQEGVDHVMRIFLKHYTGAASPEPSVAPADKDTQKTIERINAVICDEETIER